MNIFLNKDGIGFSLSYRVGQKIDGSYSIMRGWTKTILKKEQVTIQDIIDRVEPQEIMVDSISFADVFQSGTQDVILYFPIIGGHYLILHEEDGVIYGIDYPVRWFQDLQEDGLYCSSGSAFFQRYYKMTFLDGDFAEHLIATRDEDVFYIGDEKQGATDEESWELYLIWREENTQNPVKRYNPFEVN